MAHPTRERVRPLPPDQRHAWRADRGSGHGRRLGVVDARLAAHARGGRDQAGRSHAARFLVRAVCWLLERLRRTRRARRAGDPRRRDDVGGTVGVDRADRREPPVLHAQLRAAPGRRREVGRNRGGPHFDRDGGRCRGAGRQPAGHPRSDRRRVARPGRRSRRCDRGRPVGFWRRPLERPARVAGDRERVPRRVPFGRDRRAGASGRTVANS